MQGEKKSRSKKRLLADGEKKRKASPEVINPTKRNRVIDKNLKAFIGDEAPKDMFKVIKEA